MTVRKSVSRRRELAEVPGDHHVVSANASDTQPARLLACLWSIPTQRNWSYLTKSETQNRAFERDEFALNQ